ncbi:MAG: ATP phosphoribosyltransferase regulatory subunit, partial [Flavobacteriales bacterium]|nr:ATP phosphoribosyltransferase regulatory subunit [Flavobacteriales bacterium]
MVKRNYIFDTIKGVFKKYGYQPIETPAMENSETLMGRYGDEGDRLIFKILNSGDFLKNVSDTELVTRNSQLATRISEKALRYDLTVPFARYVVQHRNDITFPFKRYQIQPVWRADRPQKGRYREFYQCDIDVIGSNSLLNEVEMVQVTDEVFSKLKIPVAVKINNRKLLAAIAEVIGAPNAFVDITVALDKLDKIGEEKVTNELKERGISETSVEKLLPLMRFTGNTSEKLDFLKTFLGENETGKKGLEEVSEV